MENKKRIAIIGAGPGGLAAAMLLAHEGFDVHVYEQKSQVGGRNGRLTLEGGYHFDIGPTFFLYKPLLDEVFEKVGRKLEDYVTLYPLDPLYQLMFKDKTLNPSSDPVKMRKEIERVFPGNEKGFDRYLIEEKARFNAISKVLKLPFTKITDYLHPDVVTGLPYLDPFRSLYQRLQRFFNEEELIYSMAFQAKYLGMSPWECPSAFSILSFMEHEFGLFHVKGGLNALSEAMAEVARSFGATIHLNAKVSHIEVKQKRVQSITVNDEVIMVDGAILNGDFASSIQELIEEQHRPSWNNIKIEKKAYSCSTFMLYLGLDTQYKHLEHHNLVFSSDYKNNVLDMTKRLKLTSDASFYIHNPVLLDPSVAPAGHSALYVLVPVPNTLANIDWNDFKEEYTQTVIQFLEERAGCTDLSKHIQQIHTITPFDWRDKFGVYLGATFNMAHSFDQLLYFRAHNRFNDISNLYLVGGGTHPGSGLPTIYQSALISVALLKEDNQ
jgi:phytoene desaturase